MIAATLEDALAAEDGGADRLEVVRDLERDGLTPSIDLVERITARVRIPVRVMLRETPDFEPTALDCLRRAAARFWAARVDGVVVGFLAAGRIDLKSLRRALPDPSPSVTFHRAFDALANPEAAIDELLGVPQVDRILTSGGAGEWPERRRRLDEFQRMTGERLRIVAGGGMDAASVRDLLERTAVREFHIGRAARTPEEPGAPVDASKVRTFRRAAGLSS